jgi:hypothetical protein
VLDCRQATPKFAYTGPTLACDLRERFIGIRALNCL